MDLEFIRYRSFTSLYDVLVFGGRRKVWGDYCEGYFKVEVGLEGLVFIRSLGF